jgi:phenylacetate-coenzyme A ligase PaaK-like adenylate-forming protein
LRGRLRLSAYHLGKKDVQRYLRRMSSFRPTMLYGFSRAIYMLALEAQQSNWQSDSLRLVTLTSEAASKAMITAVERGFGVPAIVEYGASECHVIAGEWTDRTLRVREDLVIVETLPRADHRFDLVITVLGKLAMSPTRLSDTPRMVLQSCETSPDAMTTC